MVLELAMYIRLRLEPEISLKSLRRIEIKTSTRKLTARVDYQDYKLDLNSKMLRIVVLNNEWVKLKLLRTVMIDINFDSIASTVIDFNRNIVSIATIPFNGLNIVLSHNMAIERVQMNYSKEWRFDRGVRDSISKHGRRTRNILIDSCHYISRKIVEIAKEYNLLIVLKDLNKLRSNVNGSNSFNKKLSLWTYRRIQNYIAYKALIEGLLTVFINPHNSSRESPIEGKLIFINYRWIKLLNGLIITTVLVSSWNLALRVLNYIHRDMRLCGSPKRLQLDVEPRMNV